MRDLARGQVGGGGVLRRLSQGYRRVSIDLGIGSPLPRLLHTIPSSFGCF